MNTTFNRALTLSAAAVMLSALSGCTIRTKTAHAHPHQPPPPAQVNPAPAPVNPAPAPAPNATPAPARQPQLLGARWVTFRAEKDTILSGHRGTFSKLRLHVSGSPLEMYNVRITFGNGGTYSPQTRLVFAQGAWSRVIDLPGNARNIRKIEFWYRSRGLRSGRANVQVFGM